MEKLEKADEYFRQKEYKKAIIIYKDLLSGKEDKDIKLKLAYSYLYLGHYEEAFNLFQQIQRTDYNNLYALSAMAFIELKEKRLESAVNLWCRINEDYPQHIKTSRALDDLKHATDPILFADTAKPDAFVDAPVSKKKFKLPFPLKYLKVFGYSIAGILSLIFILYGADYYYKTRHRRILPIIEVMTKNSSLVNSDMRDIYSLRKKNYNKINRPYVNYSSKSQLEADFKLIKKYINDHRPNMAIKQINKILYSNASEVIKEKAKLYMDIIPKPEIDELLDNPDIVQVRKKPFLYENVYVKWKGKVSNMKFQRNESAFDLLISFFDKKQGETASIFYKENANGDIIFANNDRVLILGQVKSVIKNKPYVEANRIILLEKAKY